jgi:hypothetical protein
MDAKRIDKAWVSSAAAITYRNVQPANEELGRVVRKLSDRLIPLAVINPFYAGWQEDLTACKEQFGMKGLRHYPKWHNYSLSDQCCSDLVDAATALGLFITIPIRWQNAAALKRNKPAFGAGNAIPGSGALSQGGERKGA